MNTILEREYHSIKDCENRIKDLKSLTYGEKPVNFESYQNTQYTNTNLFGFIYMYKSR